MKSFMVLFSGLKHGWVGPVSSYTITVKADTLEAAVLELSKVYNISKVIRSRQLKTKA